MRQLPTALRYTLTLFGLTLLSAAAAAQQEGHHASAPDSPAATVDAFHQALAAGDRDHALASLDPEVVIFESGGAELSREEYASHHLESDMAFSKAVARTTTGQWSGGDGDVAWVLSRSESRGTNRDREIHARGTETVLLRRSDDGSWRILHIHWSSRPVD